MEPDQSYSFRRSWRNPSPSPTRNPILSPLPDQNQSGDEVRSDDEYEPSSPGYSPRSPVYSPRSPGYAPSSPEYSYPRPSPAYAPTSPESNPLIELRKVFKRKKLRKVSGEDRISALPDCVIHQILSFLPAEDAVKSGVLSKRWMHLWTSVPNLTFRHLYSNQFTGFFKFVDETLFHYSSHKLEKFELDFDYNWGRRENLDTSIQKWLRLVTRHDAGEISLNFSSTTWNDDFYDGENRYTLPLFLFNSSSLRKLSTRLCDYAPIGNVCWKLLRVLSITHTELSNNLFERILEGTPVLEHLKLNGCWGITKIHISSTSTPRLESLELQKCWTVTDIFVSSSIELERMVLNEMFNPYDSNDNGMLEIYCFKLRKLEISGRWNGRKCGLGNVSSVIEACLTYEVDLVLEEYVDFVQQQLERIKHAKQITLGGWCIQVLSELEFRNLPSPLFESRCECLTLKTSLEEWDTYVLVSALQNLCSLEKLVLDRTNVSKGEDVFYSSRAEFGQDYWESESKTAFSCLLKPLKTVEIIGMEPYYDDVQQYLLAFVEYLLKNAVVLEKMAIKRIGDDGLWGKDDIFYLTQKLLRFPRCSRAEVLIS